MKIICCMLSNELFVKYETTIQNDSFPQFWSQEPRPMNLLHYRSTDQYRLQYLLEMDGYGRKHTEMSNKSVKCSWHGAKWGIRFTNQIKASIWTVPKKHVIAVLLELILLTWENNSSLHVTKVAVLNVNLSLFHVECSQVEMPFSCGCHCPIRSISFHISISLPWQPDCNTASDENGCLPNLMLPPSPSSLVFLI